MFRFLPDIFKSLWGHRARTLLTVSGAAVGLLAGILPAFQAARTPIILALRET